MMPQKSNSASTERRRSSSTGARKSSLSNGLSTAQIDVLTEAVTRARQDPDSAELLEVLCENNGWTLDGITQAPHMVQSLEVFLLNVPQLPVAKLFPNLTTIRLQHVALESMSDLKPLANVEELWVTDNNITKIEGLDNMTNLRKLFLTGNRITSMEGLPCLKHLRELWLCRNQITRITHIDHLRALRTLWIAENPITSLDGAFSSDMTKLHEMNLSGCQIASFAEVRRLAVLPCLRAVWFADPLFGTTPVCQLNNYTTFALHALPSLDKLDGTAISEDQRAAAASVFQKKALYYETRMTALTRNHGLLLSKANEAAHRVLQRSFDAVRDLKEVLLPIQYDLAERQMYGGKSVVFQPDSAFTTSALEDAQRELRRAVDTREMEQSTIQKRLAEAALDARQQLDHHLRRLQMELETGGNARMEALSPDGEASWFESAKELLVARFDAERFKANFGIDGITVTRVFRVHNRGRRLNFDEHVKALRVDLSEPYNRKRLVCLLSAVPKTAEGQRLLAEYVVEHGCDAIEDSSRKQASAVGIDSFASQIRTASEGVPLTNSLFLADEGRLRAAEADGTLGGVHGDPNVLSGSIVVSRVFMGKYVAALGSRSHSSASAGPASGEAQAFMTGTGSRVWRKDYRAGTFAAYRALPDDNAIKVWHCFDRALVLPEFVIEYTYTSAKGTALSSPSQPPLSALFPSAEAWREQIESVLPDVSPRDYGDLRDTVAPLMAFMMWCGAAKVNRSPTATGTPTSASTSVMPMNTLAQVAQAETESALEATDALSAVVQKREAATASTPPSVLTAALVESYFSALDNPTSATFCQLRGQRLTAVPADFQTNLFASLTALDMSKNHLATVSWHAIAMAAPALQHLNLSDNQLQRLNLHSSQMPNLLTLDLSFNQLDSLEEFQDIVASFPKLESLHAEENPCFLRKNAECVVLSYLFTTCPHFERLNGVQLSALYRKRSVTLDRHDRSLLLDESAAPAHSKPPTRSPSVSQPSVTASSKESAGQMDMCIVSLQWLVDAAYAGWSATAVTGPSDDRFEDALSSLGAMALSAREKIQFLRSDLNERAKARRKSGHGGDNGHTSLSTVSRVCITETLLRTLNFVSLVPNLQHLELRGNCLDDISPVLQLPKLQVLNVEDNNITTLPRLSDLKHLRELNVSYNQLTSLTPLGGPLKALRRLNVNGNRLETLDVPLIAACEKLEELYAATNRLDSPKELNGLRDMPSLTSLDVCANPLFSGVDQAAEEVRQYLVYSLPKLKVLDGIPISPGESQRAQGTFAGKLSGDLLTERARGPQARWDVLKELDLSRCALREVSLLSAFTSLEILKLDHNGLVKIDGIASLSHLKALNLSYNKLGTTSIGYTGGVLKQIPSLESLSLEANHIQDMAHVGLDQPALLFLNLKGNELQFVDNAFSRLPNLRELILDQNRLRAIGPQTLAACRHLVTFSAEENALRTIDGLSLLNHLTTLRLGANRIAEINQLTTDLAACPLTEAVFTGNPAARKPSYRPSIIAYFSRLVRLDNKDISEEERERAMIAKNTAYMAPPNVFIDMSYIAAAPGAGSHNTGATNTVAMPFSTALPSTLPPVQGQLRSMTSNVNGRGMAPRGTVMGRGGARGGRRR